MGPQVTIPAMPAPPTPVPSPAALHRETVTWLRAHAEARYAEGARAYFKKWEPVHLFGVRTPVVRRWAGGLVRRVRGTWTIREALAFADRCTRDREMETKFVGWVLLGRWHRDFPAALPATARRWILAGHCRNWAHIDALSGEVLARWVERHPLRVGVITGWHTAPNPWLRRASVVPLVRAARNGRHLDEAYRTALALAGDAEDLMHKACGWLLREAGKTDMARLEAFLRRHGPVLPRTTVRYAIERFTPAHRARLLAETRPARPA
jgi:3-methyladenine DNA glycosylase AlkD